MPKNSMLTQKTAVHLISKQIHLVAERFILKIHQNTTNYSYFLDVSVSTETSTK